MVTQVVAAVRCTSSSSSSEQLFDQVGFTWLLHLGKSPGPISTLDIPTLYIDPTQGRSFALEFEYVPEFVTFVTSGFGTSNTEHHTTVSWERLAFEPFPLLIPESNHLIFISVSVLPPGDASSSPLSSERDSS